MTEIAYALYAIGIIMIVGVVVSYVKRNPKLSAELQAEFNKLHDAAATMMDHLHMIHTVASAPVSVAIIPTVAPPAAVVPNDSVTDALPALKAAAAVASDPSNPFVAWKAQGLDLWQCEGLKYLNRAVTAADLPLIQAAGYVLPQGILDQIRGNASLIPDPTWDPNQTNVTPDDMGKNFHLGPGAFSRTLTIPDGYTGGVKCSIDKINDRADDAITITVDDVLVTPPSPTFPLGPFAVIRGAGRHTISGAASNNVFVWQMQPAE